jgi:hypothetical protein
MAKKPLPTVKAFLICDQVIRGIDGKHSIIGVFSNIHSPSFPVFHSRFGVYIKFGSLAGKYNMALKFISMADSSTLGEAKAVVEHSEPLTDFETGMMFPGIHFQHAGKVEVHLFCDDELLHVGTITVAEIKK